MLTIYNTLDQAFDYYQWLPNPSVYSEHSARQDLSQVQPQVNTLHQGY